MDTICLTLNQLAIYSGILCGSLLVWNILFDIIYNWFLKKEKESQTEDIPEPLGDYDG